MHPTKTWFKTIPVKSADAKDLMYSYVLIKKYQLEKMVHMPGTLQILVSSFLVLGDLGCVIFFMKKDKQDF